MAKTYDCSGWATKANMLCADGRIIMKDAFKECDGETVPLVWNHQHNSVEEVLGHALLENRDEGVYAYCTFNDTESGQNAKLLVQHGDVNRFSIFANRLKQQGNSVTHGIIRELSLVLAGANPGAVIESVIMHGEDSYEEGYIWPDEYIENVKPLFHSESGKKGDNKMAEKEDETNDKTIKEVLETLNEEQKKAVCSMLGMLIEDYEGKNTNKEVEHSDKEEEKTMKDIFETLTDEQKDLVYLMIGKIMEDNENDKDDEGGNTTMKHNVFDTTTNTSDLEVLTHSEISEIMSDAKRCGSLRDAVLQHGIEKIDTLFPDAQSIEREPGFIKRKDDWVFDVMNSVHKTPFSRIKSVFADITADDARAKGYIKGNQKEDEVFTLLKRITTSTTVYKKQKLDRDDVTDITGFDIVMWLKKEMRMMLDEEIARAILVGDGRPSSSNDKINEQNIRPIWTDDDIYTIKASINVSKSTTNDEKTKAFIKACIKSRKDYKGSGNPNMYISEDMLTDCLLLEDQNGRIIYDSVDKLATTLRVRKIVPVPVMENLKREVGAKTHTLAGIYVNLDDYNIGADKGGSVNLFDDFDIDYNAQKYLIETRCSGALIKPYSAVAVEFVQDTSDLL